MPTMRDFALNYARRFNAVIPIAERGKVPLIRDWTRNYLRTETEVLECWTKWPTANIGLPTGQASGGILVIDFDNKPEIGINGLESLRNWEMETGKKLPDETWTSITGGGGCHWFYHTDKPIQSFSCASLGVDVRADGGQVILPPSVHANGRRYTWEYHPSEFDLLEANGTVFEFIDYLKTNSGSHSGIKAGNTNFCGGGFTLPEQIVQGERQEILKKFVGALVRIGLDSEMIKYIIRQENLTRCVPPMGSRELEKQIFPAIKRFQSKQERRTIEWKQFSETTKKNWKDIQQELYYHIQ